MTINTSMGGLNRPINKSVSMLWYTTGLALPETFPLKGTYTDPKTAGLNSAGAISVDGIVVSPGDSKDPEALPDWAGNVFDYAEGEAGGDGSVSFSLLEVLNASAMKLAYSNVESDEDGGVSYYGGATNPVDTNFWIETRIKSKRHCTLLKGVKFQTRGEETIANDELAAVEVTYTLTSPPEKYIYDV